MKFVVAITASVTTALAFTVGTATGHRAPDRISRTPAAPARAPFAALRHKIEPRRLSSTALSGLVETYCSDCHNDAVLAGNLSLEHYSLDSATVRLATSETM